MKKMTSSTSPIDHDWVRRGKYFATKIRAPIVKDRDLHVETKMEKEAGRTKTGKEMVASVIRWVPKAQATVEMKFRVQNPTKKPYNR